MHRRAALNVAIGELGRMGVRVLRRIAGEIGVEGETVVMTTPIPASATSVGASTRAGDPARFAATPLITTGRSALQLQCTISARAALAPSY